MAGELASAIAKTGQPRNRPQSVGVSEEALDNAFNGRRRADEAKAAKEAADRDKRLEEISKNTIFSKQFKNDIYNRQFQEVSKAKLDNIYKTYSEGGNLTVEGIRAIQELRDVGETLFAADTQMFNARTAYDKSPEELGWFSLGGKRGTNIFATLDDPTYDGKVDEINADYENPAFNMRKVNVGGVELNVGQFNPAAGSTINGYKTAEQLISAEDATELVEDPNILSYQGNSKKRFYYTPSKDLATKTAILVSGDARVGNDAVLQEYKKQAALAAQKGEYLSPSKFFETANIADITTNNADEIANKLSEKQYNQQYVNYSPSAPREAKATPTQKNYNGWSPEPTYDRNTEETLMSLGQGGANPRVTDFLVPVGTKSLDATGKLIKSDLAGSPIAQKTIAKGVATLWNDSEKGKRKKELYMKYLIDSGAGYVAQYVPATNANFREFAQITQSTETEEDMQALLEATGRVVGTGGKEIMDGFTKELYGVGVTAKFPSGKPAATTTKMNAQGKVTPASKTPSFQ